MESGSPSTSFWESLTALGRELRSATSTAFTIGPRARTSSSSSDSPPVSELQSDVANMPFTTNRETDADTRKSAADNNESSVIANRIAAEAPPPGLLQYIVCKGDTLDSVSMKCNTNVRLLKRYNRLFDSKLFKDQRLLVFSLPDSEINGNHSRGVGPINRTFSQRSSGGGSINETSADQDSTTKTQTSSTTQEAKHSNSSSPMGSETLKTDSSVRDDGLTELDHVICVDAVACLGRKRVSGELMVTPYGLMFEPSLRDSYVQQYGLMEFQFCIDLRDVRGCAAVMQRSTSASALDSSPQQLQHDTRSGWDNSLFDNGGVANERGEQDHNAALDSAESGSDHENNNSSSPLGDATPWFLQVVWASAYVGRSNDSVLYFQVNFTRVEALVERLQALMVREAERRASSISRGLPSRPTLTSGNPLMSADTFEDEQQASKQPMHTYGQSTTNNSEPALETKGSNESWINVNSSNNGNINKKAELSEEMKIRWKILTSSSSDSAGASDGDITPTQALRRVPNVLPSPSQLLSLEQITDLEEALPDRCRGYTWRRAYDFERDGVSLDTLFERVDGSTECLLCIQTTDGSLIGAFVSAELSKRHSGSFYGTGETFVFSYNPDLEVFHWTGENELCVSASSRHLGFGGGGAGFSLMLDSELLNGSSTHSETFANPGPLAHSEFFTVAQVEVYVFELHDLNPRRIGRTSSLASLLADPTS